MPAIGVKVKPIYLHELTCAALQLLWWLILAMDDKAEVHGGWRSLNSLMDTLEKELQSDELPPEQWKGKAVQRGVEFEDIALEQAAFDRKWDLIRPPFVLHPKVSFIGASSDALICKPGYGTTG